MLNEHGCTLKNQSFAASKNRSWRKITLHVFSTACGHLMLSQPSFANCNSNRCGRRLSAILRATQKTADLLLAATIESSLDGCTLNANGHGRL